MEEKQGGRTRLENDSSGLREFIQNNQLIDIQTSNGVFTWTNKHKGTHHITSRLDRFLISDNTIHLGGDFHTSIIPQGGSDHRPIMSEPVHGEPTGLVAPHSDSEDSL